MTLRAINWDRAPAERGASVTEIRDVQWPCVLPRPKPRAVRRVGVVESFSRTKPFGLVKDCAGTDPALFVLDDVVPEDRSRLALGQDVCFETATGPDGLVARQVRIDNVSLPSPPDGDLILRGWR